MLSISMSAKVQNQRFRSVGITSVVEVDGKVYLSRGMGITGAGISLRSTRRALRLLHTLKDVAGKLKQDPEHLRPNIEQTGKDVDSSHVYHSLILI